MHDQELTNKASGIIRRGVPDLFDPPGATRVYSLEEQREILRTSEIEQKKVDFRSTIQGLILIFVVLWIAFEYLEPVIANLFAPKATITQKAIDEEDDGTGL